jgi:hypothetical protein
MHIVHNIRLVFRRTTVSREVKPVLGRKVSVPYADSQRGQVRRRHFRTFGFFVIAVALWGCGDRGGDHRATSAALTVHTATCGPKDRPEVGLQGQVPAPLRKVGGFAGFSCDLELAGQSRGDGAGWQAAFFTDAAGHDCAYYDTSPSKVDRTHTGVVVVDVTDLTHPTPTDYLTSEAMDNPLESLKVNERRQLLGAVKSLDGKEGPELELYDLSVDCRSPRLLSHLSAGAGTTGASQDTVRGDEGSFSPDGLTYYATNLRAGSIYVIDIADPQKPKFMAVWSLPFNQRTSGLSISDDGNRAYLTLFGHGLAAPASDAISLDNGIVIADVSEVQLRKPSPQIRVISTLLWGDGSASHQTMPVRINGSAYLIASDQGGSSVSNASGWAAACSARLPAWSMVRIIDIHDEQNPKITAKLQLETNDPRNCDKVIPDLAGLSGFTYDSHYCSVDNKHDATTLACAFFESGIRVFDIRDPLHPREIAYFVPASVTIPSPGSQNTRTRANGRPDHCSAQMRLNADSESLMTTCQDSGFLALKFAHGAWPFPSTTTPKNQQN